MVAVVFTLALAFVPATDAANWPMYLHDVTHTSKASSSSITPQNVGTLVQAWRWQPEAPTMSGQPAAALDASPTVFNGRIYIGANTGVFYALNETTGQVVWKRMLDYVTAKTCSSKGITSTAAVVPDPASGALTVYVAGARNLYALDPSTGAIRWQTRIGPAGSATANDYYNWSSPTVVGGRIFIGISSQCDDPLVRGGLISLDQHTGAVLHTYWTVPAGAIGGSIWSSAAAASNAARVWVSTGNEDPNGTPAGDSISIVRLDAATLQKKERWTVSGAFGADLDFGSSPTLFSASLGGVTTPLVGACNKNGRYYALKAYDFSGGPVWSLRVGASASSSSCITSAAWDVAAKRLYVAANSTTLGGVSFAGSIRALNPATGAVVWERGLPCPVLGSPSASNTGLVAMSTYCGNGITNHAYVVNTASGVIAKTLTLPSNAFPQPVFVDNYLLVGTRSGGLFGYRPS